MPNLASGDVLYRLYLKGFYGSVPANNRFWYIDPEGATGASLTGIRDAFLNDVVDEILEVVTFSYQSVGLLIEAFSLGQPVVYLDTALTGRVGVLEVEACPPQDAYGYRLNVESRETRPGAKRFTAVPEVDQANGFLGSGYLTDLADLTAALQNPLNLGMDADIYPTVVRDVLYPNGVRTPLPIEQWVYNLVTTAVPHQSVRSQVSRRHPII